MFLRSLTTSSWLRKNCNDIFTYQQLELVARHLHPELASRTCIQSLQSDTCIQSLQSDTCIQILTFRLCNCLVNVITLNLDILLCQN